MNTLRAMRGALQVDDRPRKPLGRCGLEPSREPGKLSSPVPMRSERIAGSAGIPRTTDPSAGMDQTDTGGVCKSGRRARVQRACPPPRRIRRRERIVPHAALVLTVLLNQIETNLTLLSVIPLNTRLSAHTPAFETRKSGGNDVPCHRANYAQTSERLSSTRRSYMSKYNNAHPLHAQLDKLARHNRQGSFQTRHRYYEAMKRFCLRPAMIPERASRFKSPSRARHRRR